MNIKPLSVADMLEADIKNTASKRNQLSMPRDLDEDVGSYQDYAPPMVRASLEQPMITAEDLGRITAEAVKTASEASAKACEALGKDMEDLVRRIETLKIEALKDIESLKGLAEKHRENGKLMSDKVEAASAILAKSRDMIEDMRREIALG